MITLKDAIYLEKIDEVKRILEENPPLIDEVDEDGVLMALLAAKTGNLNLVRYIVEYSRASMNITDKNQKNMLHYAAMSGNVATCKYLVEHQSRTLFLVSAFKRDRKSTRLNSSHTTVSRMPSSA